MTKTIKVIVIAIISLVVASCAGKQGTNVDDVVEITPSFTEAVHQYDELYPFSEGLAAVKNNDKFGFINTKGELVIPCQYQYAGQFKEGLACVVENEENNNISFIDAKGEMLHTKYPFNSWYYMGGTGQTYLGSAISFTNGVCEIKYTLGDNIGEEPQIVYVDRQMKEVAQPSEVSTESEENLGYEIFSVSDKDIYGKETNLVGVKDKDGKIVIPAKYYDLEICDNGVVLARMFIESAESRFYQDKIGYGLTVYGYIDYTGKSTFTDADMGKLEGYKEAQIPAMAQLKLEAEQEERQAQYEEEQRRIEEANKPKTIEMTLEYTMDKHRDLLNISGSYGCISINDSYLASKYVTIPEGKKWTFRGVQNGWGAEIKKVFIRGKSIYPDKTYSVDSGSREVYQFYGGDVIRVSTQPKFGTHKVTFTFIESSEYE